MALGVTTIACVIRLVRSAPDPRFATRVSRQQELSWTPRAIPVLATRTSFLLLCLSILHLEHLPLTPLLEWLVRRRCSPYIPLAEQSRLLPSRPRRLSARSVQAAGQVARWARRSHRLHITLSQATVAMPPLTKSNDGFLSSIYNLRSPLQTASPVHDEE